MLSACAGSEAERAPPVAATVARVGDEDSLDLHSGARVRLVQIDAPELGERECYSRESRTALERLVPRDTEVELESDPRLDDVDRYGRLLRYVHAAGRNVNLELVRRGAAAPYFRRGVEGRHASELLDAVVEARDARRGMWGACRVTWVADRPVLTRTG